MREICTCGSVGAPGGQPPGATRNPHAIGGGLSVPLVYNTSGYDSLETPM